MVSLRLNSFPFLKLPRESQSESTDESCNKKPVTLCAYITIIISMQATEEYLEVNRTVMPYIDLKNPEGNLSLNCGNNGDAIGMSAPMKHPQRNDSTSQNSHPRLQERLKRDHKLLSC